MQYWRLIKEVTGAGLLNDPGADAWGDQQIPDDFLAADHPKFAFNFTMEVEFANGVLQNNILGNEDPTIMNMALKTCSRPSPTVTYIDANYYNYRTKVATKIDFGTITAVFYDDGTNLAHDFYTTYLKAISPITSLTSIPSWGDPNGLTASTIGVLDRAQGILQSITVYHYYRTGGQDRRTIYRYINPKVVNFVLDDLNMTQSDVNVVSLAFTFDSVNIQTEGLESVGIGTGPA
jgi:hypothetical protein